MALEELVSQLNAADEAERAWAAEDVGAGDLGAALPALMDRLLVEPSQPVREALLGALSRLTDPTVPARVAALLTHPDASLRNGAVALLRSRGAAAIPAVRERFLQGDADLRKLALDVLGAIEAEAADELYEAALRDPEVNVRIAAVECVGEHRRGAFLPWLEATFLDEREPMMVSALFGALASIGAESSWRAVTRRYPGFEEVPAVHRGEWLRALAQWGPADSIERVTAAAPATVPEDLLDALQTLRARFGLERAPASLVAHLESLLGASIPSATKYRIVAWLGGLTELASTAPLLAALAHHADPLVVLCARKALAGLETGGPR